MNFDFQPTLRGELVQVRPLRADDFSPLYEVAKDPLLWEQHPDSDRHERLVFEAFFKEAIAGTGALFVEDLLTGKCLGSSRFHQLMPDHSEIAIGYTFLARSCWGRGYNLDLKKVMLAHAFREVESVVFRIGKENWRSRKAVEKLGAQLEAEFLSTRQSGAQRPGVRYRLRRGEEAWA